MELGTDTLKSNNLVAVGVAVLLSLGALFGALKVIPYADREEVNNDISSLQASAKTQWQVIKENYDKSQNMVAQNKKDSEEADIRQQADIKDLQEKNINLTHEVAELKGEVSILKDLELSHVKK